MEFRQWLESKQHDKLLAEIRPVVLKMLYKMHAREEEVEDIAQKVLISVWRNLTGDLGSLPKPEKFNAWLWKVAHNTFINYIMSKEKRRMPTIPEPLHVVAPEEAEEDERIPAMKKAYQLLRPMDRQIIDLFYFQGIKTPEIAKMLDIPKGTVKRRLHTARKRLEQQMKYV